LHGNNGEWRELPVEELDNMEYKKKE